MSPVRLLPMFVLALHCGSVLLLEILIDSMQPDPNTNPTALNFGTLRVTRKERARNTFRISGTMYIFRNMGNDVLISMEILKKDRLSGKFSTHVVKNEQPMCQYLDNEHMFLPHLREVSNFPPAGACPFPKMNVTVNDYEFDEKMFPPLIPPGEYKIHSRMLEENRLLAGMDILVTIH